ncbi:hypothetical protein [Aeoliella mucimassa]|uniref:Uncharacterized protein n=1 Tax=Aeoliella mucimassa TaxID=2527972 RepID=A0A518AWC3_9BACT|nr:hypothetical protein [Aeoliella mucimassa]QDU59029.1 hypothetical protein Pan181_52700 [Aeoliella mucimassa]
MTRRLSMVLVALFAAGTIAETVSAQFILRRDTKRDLKAMEEYYDDLEDFYEDRNPRLAREAERMENYYEDLRKGRRVAPPVAVGLPRVQILLDSALPRAIYQERSVLVPRQGVPAGHYATPNTAAPNYAAQPQSSNGRWQSWGATPPAAKVGEPTPAPELAEAYRVPTDTPQQGGLVAPPNSEYNPPEKLLLAVTALRNELNSLAGDNPNAAAQWMEFLAIPAPAPEAGSVDASEFYNTAERRKQLLASIEHFDQVANDPAYEAVNKLESFEQARGALHELHAWFYQQPTLAAPANMPEPTPAEELPTPPGQ